MFRTTPFTGPLTCKGFNLQMPLFTIMVMDEHGSGVPVGWFIAGKEDGPTVTAGLRAWADAVRSRVEGAAEWKPSCAVVDDAATEHGALR